MYYHENEVGQFHHRRYFIGLIVKKEHTKLRDKMPNKDNTD